MPTPIEWCDETFNPWWGCERVSPACAHCYADTFAIRLGMKTLWPKGGNKITAAEPHAFRFFGDKHWDEPLKWARALPAKLGRRPRVFCASMADVFEERDEELELPRRRLFALINDTPELDWLVLTKRPEKARDWLFDWYLRMYDGLPLPNVWLGVSIENARYTWRADVLREIPAAVRFISAEPLLVSLYAGDRPGICGSCNHSTLGHGPNGCDTEVSDWGQFDCGCMRQFAKPLDLSGIDWVIIGGESGPKARPFHLEHAREIIRTARETGTRRMDGGAAVFVKQLGAKPVVWPAGFGAAPPPEPLKLSDRKGGDMDEWPTDLRIREFPRSAVPA